MVGGPAAVSIALLGAALIIVLVGLVFVVLTLVIVPILGSQLA